MYQGRSVVPWGVELLGTLYVQPEMSCDIHHDYDTHTYLNAQ